MRRARPGRRARRMRRERPAGGPPPAGLSVFWGGSGVAGSPIGVAAHTAPARHRGASRYRRGVVPCGPLRVLGHCPAGRPDRRRAPGRRLFIFMRPRRGSRVRAECPPGGLPPAGLSVFGGLSLPEDLREAFLLDRSCARHAQEDLRGPPCGHSNVNVV